MRKKSGLRGNAVLSIVDQIVNLVLPFLTAPYLARVLGAAPLGIYSKTHSMANYFFLFAMLGVNNYGNRAIARVRDSRQDRSRVFWEIYAFQALMSVIMIAAYTLFCLPEGREDRAVYLLQIPYVVSALLNINWLCFGLERFRLSVIRSIAIRLVILAGVFALVRSVEDLGAYTLILSGVNALSALAVWPFLMRDVDPVRPSWKGIRSHIRANLLLFWPVVAVSLYNVMDKVLLGAMSANEEVAFYTSAEQIVTIPTMLILAMDNVVMPRMSNIFAKNDHQAAERLMNLIMLFAMLASAGFAFGVAAVSDVFAPWFYGSGFERCGWFIFLLSPTILVKGWAGALRTQYIIPVGRDRVYVISLTVGAVVNIVLDLLLIPRLNGVGAIAGTVAAETAVAFVQFFACRKEIPLGRYLRNGLGLALVGAVMYVCVRPIRLLPLPPLAVLILQAVTGVVIFAVLSLVFMVKVIREPELVNEACSMLRLRKRF